MIFKVILFFITSSISALYSMERHTYRPSSNQTSNAPIEKLISLAKSIHEQKPSLETSVKPKVNTLTINLSKPFDDLVVFKTGSTSIENINNARAATNQLAHLLELTVIYLENKQPSDFYSYLQKTVMFKDIPYFLKHTPPEEIVLFYIADCYKPLVQESITTWFYPNPELKLNDSINTMLNKTRLQLAEIFYKLSMAWEFYAHMFSNDDRKQPVSMLYPKATITIQTWKDITYKIAKNLYDTTEEGIKAKQIAIAQNIAEIKKQQQTKQEKETQIQDEKKRRRQAEINENQLTQEKLQKAFDKLDISRQELFKEKNDITNNLLGSSIKQAKVIILQEQKAELEILKETTTITDPSIMLINDELDTALMACEIISKENITETDKTILASLIEAYEWLQEPQIKKDPFFMDEDSNPEPFDNSYLHLKYKFNQQKLLPELLYLIKKTIYTWNMYGFVRYAGKTDTAITLKFSPTNNPKKSINDWILFTHQAGFSYAGQLKKLISQKPYKSIGSMLFEAYKWIKAPKRKIKLSEEHVNKLLAEVKANAQNIEEDEQAELTKIKRLVPIHKDLVKNPTVKPTIKQRALTPTTANSNLNIEETSNNIEDFDPSFAEELRRIFANPTDTNLDSNLGTELQPDTNFDSNLGTELRDVFAKL